MEELTVQGRGGDGVLSPLTNRYGVGKQKEQKGQNLFDAGQLVDGRSYLVMEHVDGKPLSQFIPPGGLALPRAARLLRQIARALAAAHSKGIVHRDLTPNNILLQNPGGEAEQIKLIDFGLATVREALAASGPLTTMVAGTPPFMAPEQMRGKPEKASDIYALGVLAYQIVTGRLPFTGQSLDEIHAAQQAGIKALPRESRPELPQAAQTAILRALALKPEEHYDSPVTFSEDFQRALDRPEADALKTNVGLVEQPDASLQPATRRGRWWLLVGGVLAVLLLGGLAWRFLLPTVEKGAPASVPVTLPVVAGRTLSYSLLAQKNPNRYPGNQQFVPPGETVFEAGDQVRLNVSSPQAGYLYVINERPAQANRPVIFNVLFPIVVNNRDSAAVAANQPFQIPPRSRQPELDWLELDQEKGVEKIWLVWSEQIVPELEAVKDWANPKDQGEIRDRSQAEAVKRYLAAQSTTAPKAELGEAGKWMKLTGKGSVLIGLVEMEHR